MKNTYRITETKPFASVETDIASYSLIPTELLMMMMEKAGMDTAPLLAGGDDYDPEVFGLHQGYVLDTKGDGCARLWNAEDRDGNKAVVLTLPFHDEEF